MEIDIPLSDSLSAKRAREVWKAAVNRGCLGRTERAGRRRMRYDIFGALD
jgi:hypothetical protein